MLTLVYGVLSDQDPFMLLGYILSILESLFVVARILSCFVPSDTKFGKILEQFMTGTKDAKEVIKDEQEKHRNNCDSDPDDTR